MTAIENKHPDKTAEAFIKYWYCRGLGIPKKIISDLGKEFINKLWTQMLDKLGVVQNTVAPFHSQANGQVERGNRDVRTILRSAMIDSDMKKEDWRKMLPFVEFAINSATSSVTGFSPFTLLYGRRVNHMLDLETNEHLNQNHPNLFRWFHDLQAALRQAQIAEGRVKRKAQSIGLEAKQTLKKGDIVVIVNEKGTKNEPRNSGPFIIYNIDNRTTTLESWTNAGEYLDRDISKLRRVHLSKNRRNLQEHVVERILDRRKVGRKVEYLVLWEGCSKEDATWEPMKNLNHAKKAIEDYKKSNTDKSDIAVDANQKKKENRKEKKRSLKDSKKKEKGKAILQENPYKKKYNDRKRSGHNKKLDHGEEL